MAEEGQPDDYRYFGSTEVIHVESNYSLITISPHGRIIGLQNPLWLRTEHRDDPDLAAPPKRTVELANGKQFALQQQHDSPLNDPDLEHIAMLLSGEYEINKPMEEYCGPDCCEGFCICDDCLSCLGGRP